MKEKSVHPLHLRHTVVQLWAVGVTEMVEASEDPQWLQGVLHQPKKSFCPGFKKGPTPIPIWKSPTFRQVGMTAWHSAPLFIITFQRHSSGPNWTQKTEDTTSIWLSEVLNTLLIFVHYWMWKTWWCLRNPTGNACSPMFKHFSDDFVTGANPQYPQKNSPLHLHWILHLQLTWQKA